MPKFTFIVSIDIGGDSLAGAYASLSAQLDAIDRLRSWRGTSEAYGADGREIAPELMDSIVGEQ